MHDLHNCPLNLSTRKINNLLSILGFLYERDSRIMQLKRRSKNLFKFNNSSIFITVTMQRYHYKLVHFHIPFKNPPPGLFPLRTPPPGLFYRLTSNDKANDKTIRRKPRFVHTYAVFIIL